MDLGLRERVCVVTGSTGGIGLETARLLCEEGARVVVTGIPPRERQVVSYTFVCRRRGRFTVGPSTIVMTDPFGLARVRASAGSSNELIVYPAVEDLDMKGLAVQGAGSGDSAVRMGIRTPSQ